MGLLDSAAYLETLALILLALVRLPNFTCLLCIFSVRIDTCRLNSSYVITQQIEYFSTWTGILESKVGNIVWCCVSMVFFHWCLYDWMQDLSLSCSNGLCNLRLCTADGLCLEQLASSFQRPLQRLESSTPHHGSLQERLHTSQIRQHCLWWSLFSLHGLRAGDGLISWSLALSTLTPYSPTTSSLAQMLVTQGDYGLIPLAGDQPHLRRSRIWGQGRSRMEGWQCWQSWVLHSRLCTQALAPLTICWHTLLTLATTPSLLWVNIPLYFLHCMFLLMYRYHEWFMREHVLTTPCIVWNIWLLTNCSLSLSLSSLTKLGFV